MHRLGNVSSKEALVFLGVIIVVGGFVLALYSNISNGLNGSFGSSAPMSPAASDYQLGLRGTNNDLVASGIGYQPQLPQDTVIGESTTTYTSTTTSYTEQGNPYGGNSTGVTQGTGSMLEFSSDITIQSSSPQDTATEIIAMAYSAGGYVAYQSTSKSSAYVVIRVPASTYQQTISKVENLGTLVSTVSNSNDVRVQYTDLNATLASLVTEQGALLRLLNKSASINTTLSIEGQLQGVDQQINDIESQILQTRTLVEYSTIDVTVSQSPQNTPLTISLKVAPENGTAPFSVTFDAIVKGGAQPYVVNYNFGDGSGDQGQILIHTYYQTGDYKVTVTATDQNGTVALTTGEVHVYSLPGQGGFIGFLGTVGNLFVSVVEGIVEVAVVVLPLAAVGAAVIIPLRRKSRGQNVAKQSQ
jgi:hypothetical protein